MHVISYVNIAPAVHLTGISVKAKKQEASIRRKRTFIHQLNTKHSTFMNMQLRNEICYDTWTLTVSKVDTFLT